MEFVVHEIFGQIGFDDDSYFYDHKDANTAFDIPLQTWVGHRVLESTNYNQISRHVRIDSFEFRECVAATSEKLKLEEPEGGMDSFVQRFRSRCLCDL